MSGVQLGGCESDPTIPECGLAIMIDPNPYKIAKSHVLAACEAINRPKTPSFTAPEYYHTSQEHSE